MEICSRFTGMERKDGAFLLHTDNADVKVCFVTDEIVRVRASFDHELAEESYILMTTAWEDRMDDLFKGERTRVEPFAAEVTEDDKTITFATGKVTLVVEKDPINFKLLSADGSERRTPSPTTSCRTPCPSGTSPAPASPPRAPQPACTTPTN